MVKSNDKVSMDSRVSSNEYKGSIGDIRSDQFCALVSLKYYKGFQDMETEKPSWACLPSECMPYSVYWVHAVRLYPKPVSRTSLGGGQEKLPIFP